MRRPPGHQPVFDIHVVRPVESCDLASNLPVQAEHIQPPVRRSGFVSSQKEAALRIGRMNPDCRIVRVLTYRIGRHDRAKVDDKCAKQDHGGVKTLSQIGLEGHRYLPFAMETFQPQAANMM
jgi:hypothetical protein